MPGEVFDLSVDLVYFILVLIDHIWLFLNLQAFILI